MSHQMIRSDENRESAESYALVTLIIQSYESIRRREYDLAIC